MAEIRNARRPIRLLASLYPKDDVRQRRNNDVVHPDGRVEIGLREC
jgi:hypothetical protein